MRSISLGSMVVAAALAMAGCSCGEDEFVTPATPDAGCVDPGAEPPPGGRFDSPAALPDQGCVAGSLAGIDPDGLWYIEAAGQVFGLGTIRFALGCSTGLSATRGLLSSTEAVDHKLLTDDHIFWRREVEFAGGRFLFIESVVVCDAKEDGSLHGHRASCFLELGEDGFEFCGDEPVRLLPFERLPGEAEADGLALVSEWAGPPGARWPQAFTANVRVVDGIAYIARGTDGLRIVDVSDPASPADLAHFPAVGESMNDVKVIDGPGETRYALMASDASGVHAIDVTDPTAPEAVAFFSPTGFPDHGVHTLFTESIDGRTLAYLADGYSSILSYFDVTDPTNPMLLGTFNTGDPDWAIHDLFVEDGRAYLNAGFGGLIIVDIDPDNPSSPQVVGHYYRPEEPYSHSNWVTTVGDRRISVHGDEGYGAHLEVIDVDPDSDDFLELLGSYETRAIVSIHNIQASGDRAYVAYYQDGVRVLDLSDPTDPTEIAYFNTWDPDTAPGTMFEGAVSVDADPDSGLLYVADFPRGLLILELTR